jgi:Transposase and inactivated derivatives
LQRKGHRLAIVNPFHVKCTRELDDNSQTKNDKKDPKTIAMLVKDGRFRDVYIPEDVYQELREAVSERERLVEQMISLSNQVIRWLDIRFPEFNQVFKNWRGEAAWLTLRHFPTPAKVAATGASSIVSTWRKKMKKPSLKKAEKLVNLAIRSIGRTAGNEAAEAALQNLLTQYEMVMRQKQDIEQLMQELLIKVPSASKLVDIKGMGMVAAAVIVSEIGDISRFNDPRQIQKMAGLSLRENSSGKHKGKTRISKRGRRRLREGLFRAMITMLATNSEFRQLHQRNLSREQNPLNKMESIVALCGKLIRVIFAILTKGNDYDADRMLNDMKRSMKAA